MCRVPSAGFEPAHPAPEAGALSPELRGRVSAASAHRDLAGRAHSAADGRLRRRRGAGRLGRRPPDAGARRVGAPDASAPPMLRGRILGGLASATDRRVRRRPSPIGVDPRGRGPPRAPGAPRARRLVDQRRPRAAKQADRPRALARRRRAPPRRPARRTSRRRGRRPRLRQLPPRRAGSTRCCASCSPPAPTATPGPTSATASGSRSSSSRPTRPGRSTSATGGSAATATPWRGSWAAAAGRSSASTTSTTPATRSAMLGESVLARAQRRAGARGGYQGEYVHRARRAVRGAGGRRRGRRASPPSGSSRHPGDRSTPRDRLRRVVQPGLDRGERQGRRDDRHAAPTTASSTRTTGRPGSREPPSRRHPRPGARQVERRRHLPRRRPRLPPRQVPRPGLRPGHRRLRCRPPWPGGEPARRGRRRSAIEPDRLEVKLGQLVSLDRRQDVEARRQLRRAWTS